MALDYARTFDDISRWSDENGVPVSEGRVRFAQYTVICAIVRSQRLRNILVFKGGNALDFIWQPNRSTADLDFSIDMEAMHHQQDSTKPLEDLIQTSLMPTTKSVTDTFGIQLAIHSVRQQPPGPNRTFATYVVTIGYALQDQRNLIARMSNGIPSSQIILVEISVNEPICADESIQIDRVNMLRVSTIEDIIAEKLRALLQQPIRRRQRPQDLLDIAVLLSGDHIIDPQRIAEFLQRKAAARNVAVSRAAFRTPEIMTRTRTGYDALKVTTRKQFIAFDEAYMMLLSFVDTLPISETTDEA